MQGAIVQTREGGLRSAAKTSVEAGSASLGFFRRVFLLAVETPGDGGAPGSGLAPLGRRGLDRRRHELGKAVDAVDAIAHLGAMLRRGDHQLTCGVEPRLQS